MNTIQLEFNEMYGVLCIKNFLKNESTPYGISKSERDKIQKAFAIVM